METAYKKWLDNTLEQLGIERNLVGKKEVYKYFDENGIPFKRFAVMGSLTVKTYFNQMIWKETFQRFFEFDLPFGDLSVAECDSLVADYVYDTTGHRILDINELDFLKVKEGKPFILELNENSTEPPKFCVTMSKIPGSVVLRGKSAHNWNDSLTSLGAINEIDGSLGISDCPIRDLGELSLVKGDLWITGTPDFLLNGFELESLAPIKEIEGNLTVRAHSISSLGSLNSVGGSVSLRYSSVKDLGSLNSVGGNLLLSKDKLQYYELEGITVKGQIRRYNDVLISPHL
jgi:hypothetical protein